QIDNYGPWTVTPEPRREADLQSLQARLYADLSARIGDRGGYVFPARFDNMVAVTNGLDRRDAERLQRAVRAQYPVTLSVSAATGRTPAGALAAATDALQAAGGAQDADRTEVLSWPDDGGGELQLAHFDVVDATGKYTDSEDAFTSFLRIQRAGLALAEQLHDRGALAFFVGGDNFIAVCPDTGREGYERTVEHVREAAAVDLRVGVGRGPTAAEAGMAAKYALEECRERGAAVGGDLPAVPES
ncbi:MAG: GTP cyclohydrolase IIa, partial [Halobacteriaceae archaeon]